MQILAFENLPYFEETNRKSERLSPFAKKWLKKKLTYKVGVVINFHFIHEIQDATTNILNILTDMSKQIVDTQIRLPHVISTASFGDADAL